MFSFPGRFYCAVLVLVHLGGELVAQEVGSPPPTAPGVAFLTQLPEGGAERERSPFEMALETDRDSFTPATTTVERGRLIVESAYSIFDNRGFRETHSSPELLVRYGLTERLELRFGWNYDVGGIEHEPLELERSSRVSYGVKFRVTEQECWLPTSSVVVQAFTPTSGEATRTQLVGTYVLGWELPRRWKLDAAFRCATSDEPEDHFQEWAPSIVLKVPVGERVLMHAEYFGVFSSGRAEEFTHHFFSPGVHYLITPDLEVGFRVGWGLNDQSARFFSNIGFGWRF